MRRFDWPGIFFRSLEDEDTRLDEMEQNLANVNRYYPDPALLLRGVETLWITFCEGLNCKERKTIVNFLWSPGERHVQGRILQLMNDDLDNRFFTCMEKTKSILFRSNALQFATRGEAPDSPPSILHTMIQWGFPNCLILFAFRLMEATDPNEVKSSLQFAVTSVPEILEEFDTVYDFEDVQDTFQMFSPFMEPWQRIFLSETRTAIQLLLHLESKSAMVQPVNEDETEENISLLESFLRREVYGFPAYFHDSEAFADFQALMEREGPRCSNVSTRRCSLPSLIFCLADEEESSRWIFNLQLQLSCLFELIRRDPAIVNS